MSQHFYLRARRHIAAIACTLLVALGMSTAAASTAAAADPPGVTVEWISQELTLDLGTPGRPDAGDQVTLTATFTAGASDVYLHFVLDDLGLAWPMTDGWSAVTWLEAGTSVTKTHTFTVAPWQLTGVGGSGPIFDEVMLMYWLADTGEFFMPEITAPTILHNVTEPLVVSSTPILTENGGATGDGVVREGDTVGYSTVLTNATDKIMTIDAMPGYSDFSGSATLAPGASQTFSLPPVTVTYDDMVRRATAPPNVEISWSAQYDYPWAQVYTGSATATFAPIPAEEVDPAFDASVVFKVRSQFDDSNVALGNAVAGDVIDFKVAVSNLGNVTLNYVGINRGSAWGPAAGLASLDTSQLAPGTSLPNGIWTAKDLKSGGKGVLDPYTLTAIDVARGYVDLSVDVQVAPSAALFALTPSDYTVTRSERVFLREFTTEAKLVAKSELIDTNGDGIGQAGETVEYVVRLVNQANQDLTISTLPDLTGSHVAGQAAAKLENAVVVEGDRIAKKWTHTITADDEARGIIDYGVQANYSGNINWVSDSRSTWSDTIRTGQYYAPATTLDTSATYVDLNADGFPSIGETVTFTVAVANVGTYALTGLAVTDSPTADVAGLLPAFPTSIPAGGTSTKTFDYVLTAADFARGSLWYSTEMTADGMPTTTSGTSVTLTGITFQAYATDLDGVAEGGIDVCLPTAVPTSTVTLLDKVWVKPTSCSHVEAADGYRVVAFSSPVTMGVDTFAVTVPVKVGVGAHRFALYAPDGSLVGWKSMTVKDAIGFAGPDTGAALAFTGSDSEQVSGLAGSAAALVLLGSAAVFASTRRRRLGES